MHRTAFARSGPVRSVCHFFRGPVRSVFGPVRSVFGPVLVRFWDLLEILEAQKYGTCSKKVLKWINMIDEQKIPQNTSYLSRKSNFFKENISIKYALFWSGPVQSGPVRGTSGPVHTPGRGYPKCYPKMALLGLNFEQPKNGAFEAYKIPPF